MITSMIFVCQQPTSHLFDIVSTLLYIFSYSSPSLSLCLESLSLPLCIATLIGDSLVANRAYKLWLVTIWVYDT